MADLKMWMEASLDCSSELAEAVAEVFSRYAPDGVLIHSLTKFDPAEQEEIPTGDMRVVAYFPLDEESEAVCQKLDQAIWHLGMILALDPVSYGVIADQDWMEAWKSRYEPLKLGENLIVLPSWVENSVAGERLPIVISPDMAFGTGTHPSTQLCLIALEKYGCEGKNVLDIGCGSGILAIAAARLGAAKILGVDTDQIAIDSSKSNAGLNDMAGLIAFEVGTHSNILARTDELRQAPVVLANILAPILVNMLGSGLEGTVEEDGILILGGILDNQAQAVIKAAAKVGLSHIDSLQDQDWVVLVFRKNIIP